MKAEFVDAEKATRMAKNAVLALDHVTGAMLSCADEDFDELLYAAKALVDLLGDARHLWETSDNV